MGRLPREPTAHVSLLHGKGFLFSLLLSVEPSRWVNSVQQYCLLSQEETLSLNFCVFDTSLFNDYRVEINRPYPTATLPTIVHCPGWSDIWMTRSRDPGHLAVIRKQNHPPTASIAASRFFFLVVEDYFQSVNEVIGKPDRLGKVKLIQVGDSWRLCVPSGHNCKETINSQSQLCFP